MIGAIAGDMIGKPYERHPIKHKNFDPVVHGFTDDTVLTVAVAHAILTGDDMAATIRTFANNHPHAGYGGGFRRWMKAWKSKPYNSFGNGAAMRVSPVGFAYDTEADVLHHAERSAAVTHNHPEGIKGAQATALAILLARQGAAKETIRREIANRFGYDLNRTVDEIRPGYSFDVSCQGSVPESIIAFLDSTDYIDAVKNAISLGGDADTMACIAGGIAQAFYKEIPPEIAARALERLTPDLRAVVDRFNEKFGCER
jgi:ADP-ribosylglycohydrolase